VALKGPTGTQVGRGLASANVALRKGLDLYAALRPVKSVPNVKTRTRTSDLVVVRENTESLYAGLEHIVVPGVVESLKIISEKASTRIARYAFEYAQERAKKVTAVHKANIMKLSDGLFLDCCRRVAPGVPRGDLRGGHRRQHVHAAGAQPDRYDVLLMENLYGDIISTSARAWWAASAWSPAPTSASAPRCSRPSTAPPRTSLARTSPIPRR
jgi:isocitrate dehydrogenase (NAD+)